MAKGGRLSRLQIGIVGHQSVSMPQGDCIEGLGRLGQGLAETKQFVAESQMVGRRQRLAASPGDAQPADGFSAFGEPCLPIGV